MKALMKAMDTVIAQRKGLAEAAGDFSVSLQALSVVELSPALSSPLEGLSELQLRIRELYDRQAQQDVLTLGITIDEYIRLIGSVKTAFSQRQRPSTHGMPLSRTFKSASTPRINCSGRARPSRTA